VLRKKVKMNLKNPTLKYSSNNKRNVDTTEDDNHDTKKIKIINKNKNKNKNESSSDASSEEEVKATKKKSMKTLHKRNIKLIN